MTRWSKVLTTRDDEVTLDAGWQRVRARRARSPLSVLARRASRMAPIVALAVAIVLLVRGWLAPAPHVAAFAPLALAGGSALPSVWASSAPLVVPLDDGSRLELGAQTVVTSGKSAPDRVELAIESGRATFDVKPNGPRAWVIDAGTVVVRVLGTRFTVTRTADAVEVTVERGKVQVTARGGAQTLTAGQSFASVAASESAAPERSGGELPAAASVATTSAAIVPAPLPTSAAGIARATGASAAPAGTTADTRSPSRARAVAPALVPADPMTRADALRRSGNPAGAVTVLREIIDAGDHRAPLAAFTIGKIHAQELADPTGAARWFERAITLGLPSGLDEEGHARAVECYARAGARADVARAAKRYEARFPEGRHLAQVMEWSRD